ncbi:MAG: hypothetical protein O3A20_11575 [Planctomycetota bacterium]|nr:hypothetical protein [Planctomycetota bacterium]
MSTPSTIRRSFGFLCLSPLLIALVAGLGPLGVSGGIQWPLAGILMVAMLLAAWFLGAREICGVDPQRRRLAAAGLLLVLALTGITVFAVLGPPQEASLGDNQLRYPLLLINSIAVAGALILLREALVADGEGFHSTLGFAAVLIAAPLYVAFHAMQLVEYRSLARLGSETMTPEIALMDQLSLILLFFGATLTYLATAAFAAAMGKLRWLGSTTSRVYVTISLLAALCVGIRIVEAFSSAQSPLWGFDHWSSLPGFVLLIPAVPWLMPCLLGIVLLRRAGAGAPQA